VRKLALMMGISLDGLVARSGPYGTADWGVPPEDADLKAKKLNWLAQADLHLMGRVTYEEMAGFWPTSDDNYAKPMNENPKIVFSRSLRSADWPGSTIARGDLVDEITALKKHDGKDIVAWGGAAFARSLVRLQLVDEYRLVRLPVALGSGLPLFSDVDGPTVLHLTESQDYPDGSVLSVYLRDEPHRAP
jgi:dihydrofolate reductase